MRQQLLMDQAASLQQQQLFERLNKSSTSNNVNKILILIIIFKNQIQQFMQQQSTSNNKAMEQELLARQRLYAQYRNMDFNNPNISTSSAAQSNNLLLPNNKIPPPSQQQQINKLNHLDSNLTQQQQHSDFFNSLSGQAALLNSQFMAAAVTANPNATQTNPFCTNLTANMLQKHPQSANTPNSNCSQTQNTGGSVVNGAPIKRDS